MATLGDLITDFHKTNGNPFDPFQDIHATTCRIMVMLVNS